MAHQQVGVPLLAGHVDYADALPLHVLPDYGQVLPENEEVMHNNWRFVEGPKGPSLMMGGYHFVKNKFMPNGTQHYRCAGYYTTHCKAKATLLQDGVMQISNEAAHNHAPNIGKRKAAEALSNMRKRARLESGVTLNTIYHAEMFGMEDRGEEDAMADLPMLEGVLSILKRERRKVLPPVPNALANVKLPDGPMKDSLLIDDDIGQRIMVFGREDNFRSMCGSERLHMDGTFKCAPTLFVQLFTICAVVNGCTWPLLFCLLPAKSSTVYTRLFRAILQKCNRMGIMFMPRVVFCDFEASLKKSLKYVFRHISVKGCLFHYSQAIHKRVANIGLKGLYKKEGIIRKTIRRLMYLPMLPVEDVPGAYDKVVNEDLWEDLPLRKEQMMTRLKKYFSNTWMKLFKLEQWNMWSVDVRTNNCMESFHSTINNQLPQHPTVYKLIEYLCDESRKSALYIRTGSKGMTDGRNRHKRTPKREFQDRDMHLALLKSLYAADRLTDMAFLDGVSDVYKKKKRQTQRVQQPAVPVNDDNADAESGVEDLSD